MSDLVQYNKNRDIAILTINNPPVNAISPEVLEGLLSGMEKLENDPDIKAAVLIGAGSTFIAGADIKEFSKITSGQKQRGEGLHPLLTRIESCRKPVVIAIHGNASAEGSSWPWPRIIAWQRPALSWANRKPSSDLFPVQAERSACRDLWVWRGRSTCVPPVIQSAPERH